MSLTDRWIWCQYTPGAGGKMLCSMMQLSTKVHAWENDIKDNLHRFVDSKIRISPSTHMKDEPQWPYNLSWYTRQLPFSRGDDLTIKEVETLFNKNNRSYSDYYLTMNWCKPYFPEWFMGRVVSIINDTDAIKFLKKRRDDIFYMWDGDVVILKRFVPTHIYNPKLVNKFTDQPETEKTFKDKTIFYKKEFYEHPEVFPLFEKNNDPKVKLNINLSDFWNRSGSDIAKEINEVLGLDIDLEKANYLVDQWIISNQQYL
jgi:hypothetical protein